MRGLANRSEGVRAGPVDKSEGFANRSEGLGAGLAQGLSIKVRAWGGPGWPGPVDKSEGFGGQAGPGPNLSVDSGPVLFPH